MNRLPCCDRTPARLESAVFAALGLRALEMIGLATIEMTNFVAGNAGHPRVPLATMAPAQAGRNDGYWGRAGGALRCLA